MDRHLENYGNPTGWVCYAVAASIGAAAQWLGDNAGLISLVLSAGFGGFGTWLQWQTYRLRKEAAERQRKTEGK